MSGDENNQLPVLRRLLGERVETAQREFDRIHAMSGVRTWDYWLNETRDQPVVVAAPVPEPATQAVLSTETTVDQVPGQMIVFYLI